MSASLEVYQEREERLLKIASILEDTLVERVRDEADSGFTGRSLEELVKIFKLVSDAIRENAAIMGRTARNLTEEELAEVLMKDESLFQKIFQQVVQRLPKEKKNISG